MSAGKIVLLIFGIVVVVVAIGLIATGGAVLRANGVLTDGEGYLTTKTIRIDKGSFLCTTSQMRPLRDLWTEMVCRTGGRMKGSVSTIDITPQDDHDLCQCSQRWVGGRLQSDEQALRGRFLCRSA